jgi:hypothetical protein
MRGIATGDNDFFFMTKDQAIKRSLPLELMIRAVGRTRDVEGDEITEDMLCTLDVNDRPTYLLSLNGRSMSEFPEPVQNYLNEGVRLKIHQRSLIKQRRPWYKMEIRKAPEFLFAYLGRRNARFVRNLAGVVPLTGFLCVYPRQSDNDFLEKLWLLLNHPDTLANLCRVAKSYGSGAIKVEPRALERTPISERALKDCGLYERPLESQVEIAYA